MAGRTGRAPERNCPETASRSREKHIFSVKYLECTSKSTFWRFLSSNRRISSDLRQVFRKSHTEDLRANRPEPVSPARFRKNPGGIESKLAGLSQRKCGSLAAGYS